MEKFLTVDQAAEALQVDAITLRRWLREGRIHGAKLGRVWRVPESVLRELASGKTAAAPVATAN